MWLKNRGGPEDLLPLSSIRTGAPRGTGRKGRMKKVSDAIEEAKDLPLGRQSRSCLRSRCGFVDGQRVGADQLTTARCHVAGKVVLLARDFAHATPAFPSSGRKTLVSRLETLTKRLYSSVHA